MDDGYNYYIHYNVFLCKTEDSETESKLYRLFVEETYAYGKNEIVFSESFSAIPEYVATKETLVIYQRQTNELKVIRFEDFNK